MLCNAQSDSRIKREIPRAAHKKRERALGYKVAHLGSDEHGYISSSEKDLSRRRMASSTSPLEILSMGESRMTFP